MSAAFHEVRKINTKNGRRNEFILKKQKLMNQKKIDLTRKQTKSCSWKISIK